jgi:hypothetical protein
MRVRRWFGAGLVAAAFVLVSAPLAPAVELQWFGVHAAYYDEFGKGALGINARAVEEFSPISVGFKADYIFRSNRTSWAFEVDLQYELPIGWKTGTVWVGGGGGVLHDDIQGPLRADFYPRASMFAGVGLRRGPLLPYLEIRATSTDRSRLVAYLGLRF